MIIFFDTETTGLVQNSARVLAKQPHIIELFGLAMTEEAVEVSTYHMLFNPGVVLDPIITKITGIREQDLLNKPTFKTAAESVKDFFGKATTLVAHNLAFDKFLLECEFKRAGVEFKAPKNLICTVESTEHMKGYRLSLSALHLELFGEEFASAHRAENDVRALARCYFKLLENGEI